MKDKPNAGNTARGGHGGWSSRSNPYDDQLSGAAAVFAVLVHPSAICSECHVLFRSRCSRASVNGSVRMLSR
jgi:hypothetical protein